MDGYCMRFLEELVGVPFYPAGMADCAGGGTEQNKFFCKNTIRV
jgi:hypothetical protein